MLRQRRSRSGALPDLSSWSTGRRRTTLARAWWTVPATGFGISTVALLGAYLLTRGSRNRHSPTTAGRLSPTTQTIVVNREPADVHGFWLRFDQFPRFMRHLQQVLEHETGLPELSAKARKAMAEPSRG